MKKQMLFAFAENVNKTRIVRVYLHGYIVVCMAWSFVDFARWI